MEKTPKEMMKAYVDSQKFNSTTEITKTATVNGMAPFTLAVFTSY